MKSLYLQYINKEKCYKKIGLNDLDEVIDLYKNHAIGSEILEAKYMNERDKTCQLKDGTILIQYQLMYVQKDKLTTKTCITTDKDMSIYTPIELNNIRAIWTKNNELKFSISHSNRFEKIILPDKSWTYNTLEEYIESWESNIYYDFVEHMYYLK
jgi:hypothetical protein